MNINDTIAGIATGDGYSALGIVRISGDKCEKAADTIFRPVKKRKLFENPRTPVLGFFVDSKTETHIDTVLVTWFPAGQSYTGEDMLEISTHGNPVILDKLMDELHRLDIRSALPGEFTYRAYYHAKIDLTQAEGINRLATALTITQASSAVKQAEGALSEKISAWREKLVELFSRLEGDIEFADDSEDTFFTAEAAEQSTRQIQNEIDELLSGYKYTRLMRNGVNVVITGRANAGKSTLFNLLLRTQRSIVTPTPGTTRDVVSETLDIDGLAVRLFDTAGLEEHEGELEKEGVRRARMQLKEADLVVALFDSSREITDEDIKILAETEGLKRIVVFNKDDLPSALKSDHLPDDVSRETISISALNKTGIDRLKKAILNTLGWKNPVSEGTLIIQSRRQKEILERLSSAMVRIHNSLETGEGHEILSIHVREALSIVDSLTGSLDMEDIYNRIFSNFCVGK